MMNSQFLPNPFLLKQQQQCIQSGQQFRLRIRSIVVIFVFSVVSFHGFYVTCYTSLFNPLRSNRQRRSSRYQQQGQQLQSNEFQHVPTNKPTFSSRCSQSELRLSYRSNRNEIISCKRNNHNNMFGQHYKSNRRLFGWSLSLSSTLSSIQRKLQESSSNDENVSNNNKNSSDKDKINGKNPKINNGTADGEKEQFYFDDDNYNDLFDENDNDYDQYITSKDEFEYDEFYDDLQLYNGSLVNRRRKFEQDDNDDDESIYDDEDEEDEEYDDAAFLRSELAPLESLEDIVKELEEYDIELQNKGFDDTNDTSRNRSTEDDDDNWMLWDEDSLEELLGVISDDVPDDDNDSDTYLNLTNGSTGLPRRKVIDEKNLPPIESIEPNVIRPLSPVSYSPGSSQKQQQPQQPGTVPPRTRQYEGFAKLESALKQGVVPVSAGVGSYGLPGDFGFDPLHLAEKDLFLLAQQRIASLFPERKLLSSDEDDKSNNIQGSSNVTTASSGSPSSVISTSTLSLRPRALILRDYREAEIRHGRLAMLAAIFWPVQEMIDRLLLDDDMFGGPLFLQSITLPYVPLLMTAIMLLLGYLDIYSQSIKDMDKLGEAFLPGDCFWDPLQILQGTSSRVKRNMQERELFNGRAAMIAIAAYIFEEFATGKAIVDIPSNALLFVPAYQIPGIQQWLDYQFTDTISSTIL